MGFVSIDNACQGTCNMSTGMIEKLLGRCWLHNLIQFIITHHHVMPLHLCLFLSKFFALHLEAVVLALDEVELFFYPLAGLVDSQLHLRRIERPLQMMRKYRVLNVCEMI